MANHICHFEIGCRDRDKTAGFYSKGLPNNTFFGWFADPEGNTIGVYSEKKV